MGSYCPPVLTQAESPKPPQTIIFEPVHTAVWTSRAAGAPFVVVLVQESLAASYWPPVLVRLEPVLPPQTIIFVPVHTAECRKRAAGAPPVAVGFQTSSWFGKYSV